MGTWSGSEGRQRWGCRGAGADALRELLEREGRVALSGWFRQYTRPAALWVDCTTNHGNADHVLEDDGSANTAPWLDRVPLIVTARGVGLAATAPANNASTSWRCS